MQNFPITVACLVLICSGCGPSTDSKKPKLSLLGFGLEAGKQLRTDALDRYTAQTGIEVDLIPTLGTSSEQLGPLLTLLQKRVPTPDLFLIDVIWPGTLNEHLLDLRPWMDDAAREHLAPLLGQSTIQGRVIGLPLYASAGVLYYRADLLRKYGFERPPETWDELDSMATLIQRGERRAGKPDFWGFLFQGGAYEGLTCNALEWQSAYGGGGVLESDGTISVNNDAAVLAMTKAASRIGRISPVSVLSYTESDSSLAFRSGGAAFLRQWSSGYSGIASAMKPGTVGIAPMPAGPAKRSQAVGGFLIAVSAYSKHPVEAARLALYLAGKDVQRTRALRRGYMPTSLPLLSEPEVLSSMPQVAVLRASPNTEWVPRPSAAAGPKYAEVSREYYLAVHEILAGKSSARDALGKLEQSLVRITGLKPAGRN